MGFKNLMQELFKKLRPEDKEFFDLFEMLGKKSVEALYFLNQAAENKSPISEIANGVKRVEEEADEISHTIINKVRKTFVVPIDREDIIGLCEKLDDIIDGIEKFVRNLEVYNVAEFPREMKRVIEIINRQIKELEEALPTLRKFDSEKFLIHHEKIHNLENQADQEKKEIRSLLYKNKRPDDPITLRERRTEELIKILETITDDCSYASGVILGIMLKYC